MPNSNRPILRPGPSVTSAVVPSAHDDLAMSALREAEGDAPPFVPSISNNPLTPPAPVAPPAAPAAASPEGKPEETGPKPEELSPTERWRKALEAAKITEAQALQILKAVIHKGFYEKEYSLWNGLVKVVFRTRDAHHVIRLQRALEALEDRSQFSISQTVYRANVSGSLASYQGSALPTTGASDSADAVEQAYQRRYEFVGKLPGPVFEQLTVALAHFDAIVAAAFSEGAAQGF